MRQTTHQSTNQWDVGGWCTSIFVCQDYILQGCSELLTEITSSLRRYVRYLQVEILVICWQSLTNSVIKTLNSITLGLVHHGHVALFRRAAQVNALLDVLHVTMILEYSRHFSASERDAILDFILTTAVLLKYGVSPHGVCGIRVKAVNLDLWSSDIRSN